MNRYGYNLDEHGMTDKANAYSVTPTLPDPIVCLIRTLARGEPICANQLCPQQRHWLHRYLTSRTPSLHVLRDMPCWRKLELFITDWDDRIRQSLNRGRTLFKTKKGILGLRNSAVHSGDIVVIITREQESITLRAQDERYGGGFYFVGDAYCRC